MDEKCRNCEDKQACVPFFVHENSMMHYNRVNRRILVTVSALFLLMCLTVSFIIGVLVMIAGYILMMGGGVKDPQVFNYAMFDFRRLVAAPITIVAGVVVIAVGIMRKEK